MKKILVIMVAVTGLWACSKKMAPAKTVPTPIPTPPLVTISNAPIIKPVETMRINKGLIDQGKKTFELRCGQCHGLTQPVNFGQQAWVGIMERMAPKAELDENQKAAVLAYVQHYAKDAPKDKSNI